MTETIAETMIRMSDADLLTILPYVRNENGEKVSLIELRHILRETVRQIRGEEAVGS